MSKKWSLLLLAGVFTSIACSQAISASAPQGKSLLPKKIDHIVVVVEENHSQQEIEGNPKAPYMNSLMKEGASLTNYYAIEHPSQPNYLDLFSGSNQGVTNDKQPQNKFSTDNLGAELIKHHYSFAGYSEGLPQAGYNGFSAGSAREGIYARKHNPWVNFTNIPVEANKPLSLFSTDYTKLPTVSFVIPNMKHDMHDGSIQEADVWLKNHLGSYVQWAKSHNSLLIVTWDEDDRSQKNKIPTFFVGPMVKQGKFKDQANHFNLLRTIEDMYGLGHAGKSASVAPILGIWK
ncbi:alkaline phosphatase family protein [Brevibacillus ginsengisoli]|uniref:alkaline phosphatase family protein n=1 Tax=Brevibacillus ginsengisoli TaxID=363854 RepID=UPI003CEE0F8D